MRRALSTTKRVRECADGLFIHSHPQLTMTMVAQQKRRPTAYAVAAMEPQWALVHETRCDGHRGRPYCRIRNQQAAEEAEARLVDPPCSARGEEAMMSELGQSIPRGFPA